MNQKPSPKNKPNMDFCFVHLFVILSLKIEKNKKIKKRYADSKYLFITIYAELKL
jgi:hypothetical protein